MINLEHSHKPWEFYNIYQSQHLHCNPMLPVVLLVILIPTKQDFVYVNYQLLHMCEPSQTCHIGNRQLATMYQSIH
jgi:hypothetical protein